MSSDLRRSVPIQDLAEHLPRFVTIAELADYWGVSRHQIYKHIGSGDLPAIKLGSRLYRVRTSIALEYERRAMVTKALDEPRQKIGPTRLLRRVDSD